jgi:hypothetical protein
MVCFLYPFKEINTTNWSLVGLVNGVVFDRVIFVTKYILGPLVGRLRLLGKMGFGLKKLGFELGE